MEALKDKIIVKIDEQLKEDAPSIELLDVLNRLLGTVVNYLLNVKE